MLIVRETEKGLLLEKDCVQFWVQKRWFTNCKLTPAGVKAYAIAAREHWKNFGFDAMKEFAVSRETEKAVLLKCTVELPHAGDERTADFWLPKAKSTDRGFVKMKLKEVLDRYPFVGARIKGFAA